MDKAINNPKRQNVLKISKDLFWKYGIKRVTIEEICKEACVSKMTFYKFFQNKIELAKTILDEVMNTSLNKFEELINSEIPFSEKLEGIFLMKLEGTKNISVEFINDIYNNPESGLKKYMEEIQGKSFKKIVVFYKDSQNKGYIRKDIKIDFILNYSMQIMKMMENKSLVSQYENPQAFIMESMNFMFYGILTKNE